MHISFFLQQTTGISEVGRGGGGFEFNSFSNFESTFLPGINKRHKTLWADIFQHAL